MTDETIDHSHKFHTRIQLALSSNIYRILASNILVLPARLASTADRSFYFRSHKRRIAFGHQIYIPVYPTTSGCLARLGLLLLVHSRLASLSHCGGAFQCSHGEETMGFKMTKLFTEQVMLAGNQVQCIDILESQTLWLQGAR